MRGTSRTAVIKVLVAAAIIAGVIGSTVPASAGPRPTGDSAQYPAFDGPNPKPCLRTHSCHNNTHQHPGGGR